MIFLFSKALKIVRDTLNNDEDLYRSYKDNIAMAFVDNHRWWSEKHDYNEPTWKDIPEIANDAADYFLKLWLKD